MNQGVKTIIYPVKDLARAKAMFGKLLGVEPYSDAPYDVGGGRLIASVRDAEGNVIGVVQDT